MTAHEVAMRMIRQRGTTVSQPEFIAAYLAEEHRRATLEKFRRLGRVLADLGDPASSFTTVAVALGASIRAGARFERARADVEAAMAR